jgi:nicotinate-nucleotide pyrophosphorylase (carboxylating)
MSTLPPLSADLVAGAIAAALREDLGSAGDITSAATIPAAATATATFGARKPGVLAGLLLAEAAFRAVDASVRFAAVLHDGDAIAAGAVLARVSGNARAILAAERIALNYLCHLSGIATATAALVARVQHTKARILDTRKTTPGLRLLEKYAVACGGGQNHRIGLYDAILIKDNHIAVAGGVGEAIRSARAHAPGVKLEIEVGSLAELDAALAEGPDIVMLDNMSPDLMREAVRRTAGRALLEASGNITLATVKDVAETGVDYISSGAITHSAPALDIGLDVVIGA